MISVQPCLEFSRRVLGLVSDRIFSVSACLTDSYSIIEWLIEHEECPCCRKNMVSLWYSAEVWQCNRLYCCEIVDYVWKVTHPNYMINLICSTLSTDNSRRRKCCDVSCKCAYYFIRYHRLDSNPYCRWSTAKNVIISLPFSQEKDCSKIVLRMSGDKDAISGAYFFTNLVIYRWLAAAVELAVLTLYEMCWVYYLV